MAKACRLPSGQKPKDVRDTRRQNRRLHLCEQCGAYKQAVEFYACCLHDTQRCCRECMLGRPAEPFGEHLVEEQRTAGHAPSQRRKVHKAKKWRKGS